VSRHDDAVARYQAELLGILHNGHDGQVMAEAITDAQQDLGVAQDALDVTLVEVAADLTRTWGRIQSS